MVRPKRLDRERGSVGEKGVGCCEETDRVIIDDSAGACFGGSFWGTSCAIPFLRDQPSLEGTLTVS